VAAIRAAQLGARVCLVEKEHIGGTCLNRGCIPTKALLHSAEEYLRAQNAHDLGIDFTGAIQLDFARVMQRKRDITKTLVEGTVQLLARHGIDVYDGFGAITEPGRIRIALSGQHGDGSSAAKSILCDKTIIATGSVPARLRIPGADLPGVLTSRELLDIDHLPESMVVIGGSVVGIEFATIFSAFGTRVKVLELERLLPTAEEKLAKRFKGTLRRQGIDAKVRVNCREIAQAKDGRLQVIYDERGKENAADGEVVLLSTGRWPYTQGLGLDELGMTLDGRAIPVNEHMETSLPGVYAVGDCTGGYMLAHVAAYEGELAVENAAGRCRAADYTAVPNCIFTMPEIAAVGLTERQCRERGLDYVVTSFPFRANGRALILGEPDGQVRLICRRRDDGKGGRILGMHIMGPHASDLIAEGSLALKLGATAQDVATSIHAHPTLPETVMEVAKAQLDGAIHYYKR